MWGSTMLTIYGGGGTHASISTRGDPTAPPSPRAGVPHLAFLGSQALQHGAGLGELAGVPGEVALAVGVLDVQPEDVAGDRVLLEAPLHRRHVLLVVVIPPALVVTQGEEGGQRLRACRGGAAGLGAGSLAPPTPLPPRGVPVRAAYCPVTAAGAGPSSKKTSMMPLSDIQRTSVCGVSPPPCM